MDTSEFAANIPWLASTRLTLLEHRCSFIRLALDIAVALVLGRISLLYHLESTQILRVVLAVIVVLGACNIV